MTRADGRPADGASNGTARVWIVWTMTCLLWSTVWLAIKLGVSAVPPLTFAYCRLLLALAVLLPIAAAQRRLQVPQQSMRWLLAASGFLLLGVNYGLVFWGAQFIPSGIVAVLQAVTPAFGLAIAAAAGIERATTTKAIGLASGVGGVALLSVRQALEPHAPGAAAGCAAVLLGAICVGFVYVLMKVRASGLHPTTVISWQMMGGAIPLGLAGLLIEGNPLRMPWTPISLAALGYLAIAGSVAAFWLNYWLLRRLSASAVLTIGIVEAPLAALLGAAVLHERFDLPMVFGTAFVLAGTGLVIRTGSSRESAAPVARSGSEAT